MNIAQIRKDFPILEREIDGKRVIYFDNAATSLTPNQVTDSICEYYHNYCANVHRGLHKFSDEASEKYESAHRTVGKFVNAGKDEIVFTKNTSESINLVMYSLLESGFFGKDDEIIIPVSEHHSNLIPWQFAAKKSGAELKFVGMKNDFTLNMEDLQAKISKKTKLVAIAHVSNTSASLFPVAEVGKIAHENGALFLVDAAQSVPHMPVDVKKIGADFAAFSAHKMLGPTGIGALYGKNELLEKMEPFNYGGGIIQSVKLDESTWGKVPEKFEAGTPHVAGAVGFSAAIKYLEKIGMDNVRQHGKEVTKYALEKMSEIKGLTLYCTKDAEKQGSIILFGSSSLEAHDLALALDEAENIAIRSGLHCAEPFISALNEDGLARASFYIYNTKEEVDIFIETLGKILSAFG